MNRRRLIWLSVPLVLIGIAVSTWFVLARRDTDFVTVGPMTKGVRANFAKLETMVYPAEFRDCKTVQDAMARLNAVLSARDPEEADKLIFPGKRHRFGWFRLDYGPIQVASPFALSADTKPMTVKQFLRVIFAQTDTPDVHFIVCGHYLEATTAERAQEERARYLDSVSVYDRIHNFWKEMTGNLEDDPPEAFLRL